MINFTDPNPRAVIGANNPPEPIPPQPTPFELVSSQINGLYDEAKGWLDGAPIDSADLAAGVEKLEEMLKAAIKAADEARKAENKPFDDGKAEVQARYNLLIGDTKTVKGTAIKALEACKSALTPWRLNVQAEKEAAAKAARAEAEAKAAAALAARQEVDFANLAAKEESDRLLAEAEAAAKAANRAEKATTTKTGLRTTYRAEITDLQSLLRHMWVKDPEGLRGFAQGWATDAVRSAGSQAAAMTIPGVTIHEVKESR